MKRKKRLGLEVFDFLTEDFRIGYLSDVYFWRTKIILESLNCHSQGLMQVFQKNDNAVLCGIDEAIGILKVATGHYINTERALGLFSDLVGLRKRIRSARVHRQDKKFLDLWRTRLGLENQLDELWVNTFSQLEIKALYDGDRISAHEPVMHIKGDYSQFAHLETLYLGALARGTRVASNVKKLVEAARGKPILFFPARFDHYRNQVPDGYAAFVSGAFGVSTDAQAEWWGVKGIGTIPHGLIAIFEGNTVKATVEFAKKYPNVKCISLVDFENNCVKTSIEVAQAMKAEGLKLWGVRLDTSGTMVDKSVVSLMGRFKPIGVCVPLVNNVRQAFDKKGFEDLEIVVSGGFNPQKINEFEQKKAATDAYGVGSSIFRGNYDFTGDIVLPRAKVGREFISSTRLEIV